MGSADQGLPDRIRFLVPGDFDFKPVEPCFGPHPGDGDTMNRSFYLAGAARMARIARTTDNPHLRQWALNQGKEYLLLATFCS